MPTHPADPADPDPVRPRRAADTVSGAVALGAVANVIMQLARPGQAGAQRGAPGPRSPRPSRFLTAGFLREPFRSLMGFDWSAADQERFETTMRRIGAVLGRLPGAVRKFPYNAFLADVRTRRRLGMPLV